MINPSHSQCFSSLREDPSDPRNILHFVTVNCSEKTIWHIKYDFHNFGRIWLDNKLVFTFTAPIKYTKAQFNLIILSRVIEYTTDRQTYDTDTLLKTIFLDSRGLKTWRFDKNFEINFSDKSNTLLYDGNIKTTTKFLFFIFWDIFINFFNLFVTLYSVMLPSAFSIAKAFSYIYIWRHYILQFNNRKIIQFSQIYFTTVKYCIFVETFLQS